MVTLFRQNLARQYLVLAAYLGFATATGLILLPLKPSEPVYYVLYKLLEPVLWLLQYLVVGDMVVKTFRPYPAIQKLAFVLQFFGLFVAVLSGIVVGAVASTSFWHPQFQAIHICVMLAGLVFQLVLTLELAFLPVEVSRNTKRYIAGFMLLFLADAAILFIAQGSANFRLVRELSRIGMILTSAMYVYWCFSMHAADEATAILLVRRLIGDPEFRERLRSHLLAFDRSFAARRAR